MYSNLTQINIPKLDRSQVLIAIKLLQSRKFFQSGKNIKIVLLLSVLHNYMLQLYCGFVKT